MDKLIKFFIEGVASAAFAGVLVLFIEYNCFQNGKESPIKYEPHASIDSIKSTTNFFKVSEEVYFNTQPDGILQISKKHKPLTGSDFDEMFSKIYINSISKFEIFYSPILLKKSIKVISVNSNGSFSDSFELDGAFSESGFNSYVENIIRKFNRNIGIVKKERDFNTHLWILFVGVIIFIIFRINRAINNFFDSGSKFFNSLTK